MAYLALAAGGHWSAVAAYGGVAAVVLAVAALLRGVHRGVPTWGDALVAGGPAVWVLMLVGGLGLLPAAAGKVLAWAAHRAVPALAAAAAAVVVVAHTAGPAVALVAGGVSVVPGDTAPARRPRRPQIPRAPPARTPIAARRVNRGIPCPACGGTDECYFTSDLEHVVCTRVVSDRPVRDAIHGTAWVHPVRPGLPPLAPVGPIAHAAATSATAAAWLRSDVASAAQREAGRAALDTYLRGRGFADGAETLARAGVTMTLRASAPFRSQPTTDPVYYYSYPIYRVDAIADPAAAVLALTAGGTKASISAWGGDARRTYGPRPAGAVLDLHAIRDDVVALPGLPDDGRRFVVGEGLETTLAGMAGMGGGGIACVDAGHMRTLLAHPTWRGLLRDAGAHLVILVDSGDTIQAGHRAGAGDEAAATLLAAARDAGIPALALRPPARYAHATGHGPAADWADVLRAAGAEGAQAAAVEAATAASAEVLSFPRLAAAPAAPRAIDPAGIAATLADARAALPDAMSEALGAEGPRRFIAAAATGTGKSTALAHAAAARAAMITATRAERDRLARLAGAARYPARSPDPDDPGHCPHPDYRSEVQPLADQARGVALLACATCPLGVLTMERIRSLREAGEAVPPAPNSSLIAEHMCPYTWNTERAREAATAAATAAKLAGDPEGVARRRVAYGARKDRPVALDDCPDVVAESSVNMDHLRQWIATAPRQAAADDTAADRLEAQTVPRDPRDAAERRQTIRHLRARADLLRAAQPHLEAVLQAMVHLAADLGQTRIDPAIWTPLAALLEDADIGWMDATGAEAIFRETDGTRTIPLRAVADLVRAGTRGTVWHLKGWLRYTLPAPGLDLARTHTAPIVWSTATPPSQLRRATQATLIGAGDSVPGNIWVVMHPESTHGKATCSSPDRQPAEITKLRAAIERAAAQHPQARSIAVLTHMALAQVVGPRWADDPADDGTSQCGYTCTGIVPGVRIQIGWYGRHHQAQDAWGDIDAQVVWGVPQTSPQTTERLFVGGEDAVAQAGHPADPTWDGTRTQRTYDVPGRPGSTWSQDGYARDDIDAFRREWTTAQVVQGIGRLRAASRPQQVIPVHVYATFPFSSDYGMRIDEIAAPAWRSAGKYRQAEHDAAVARVDRAAEALEREGRKVTQRAVACWLRERGQRTSAHAYGVWRQTQQAPIQHPDADIRMLDRLRRVREQAAEHAITQAVGRIAAVRPVGRSLRGAWRDRVLARRARLALLAREVVGRGAGIRG